MNKPREFWLENHERWEVHARNNNYAGETIHVREVTLQDDAKEEAIITATRLLTEYSGNSKEITDLDVITGEWLTKYGYDPEGYISCEESKK